MDEKPQFILLLLIEKQNNLNKTLHQKKSEILNTSLHRILENMRQAWSEADMYSLIKSQLTEHSSKPDINKSMCPKEFTHKLVASNAGPLILEQTEVGRVA